MEKTRNLGRLVDIHPKTMDDGSPGLCFHFEHDVIPEDPSKGVDRISLPLVMAGLQFLSSPDLGYALRGGEFETFDDGNGDVGWRRRQTQGEPSLADLEALLRDHGKSIH